MDTNRENTGATCAGGKKNPRRRGVVPPAPPAEVQFLMKVEVAGIIRKTVRAIDELRKADPSFPKPRLLGPATARWVRSEVEKWVLNRSCGEEDSGWCSTGGVRPGAFGRPAA